MFVFAEMLQPDPQGTVGAIDNGPFINGIVDSKLGV